MERQCANARALAAYLDAHEKVDRVYYPGLPAHTLNTTAPRPCSTIPVRCSAFELAPDVEPFPFMNRLGVVVKSSNLGDNRTLAIPVAHTIYYEMGRTAARQHGHRGLR